MWTDRLHPLFLGPSQYIPKKTIFVYFCIKICKYCLFYIIPYKYIIYTIHIFIIINNNNNNNIYKSSYGKENKKK